MPIWLDQIVQKTVVIGERIFKDAKAEAQTLGEKAYTFYEGFNQGKDRRDIPMFNKTGDTMNEVNREPGEYGNDLIIKRLKMANEVELMGICMALRIDMSSVQFISKKYREAAGHSIMNLTRHAQALPYKRILIDIADKLKPGSNWTNYTMEDNHSEIEIENKIIEFANARIENELQKLTPAEREKSKVILEQKLKDLGVNQTAINTTITAFTSGSIGVALATPAAMSVFYTSGQVLIASLFGVAIVPTTLQLLLTGTVVGAAAALPILAIALGGPAYRKTIPATLRLIAVRKRHEAISEQGGSQPSPEAPSIA